MWVYDIENGKELFLIGLDGINGSGGGVSKKKIIIKSDTIPEASAKTYKLIYIYAGESNGTYHHGYIYECTADVTYDAKNIYFDSHNMGFDYRNADPSKNFTSDGEAMEAFLELVLRNKDVSFLQVTNGALTRKETGMWNVQLKDKDGNILLDNYQLGPEDLEDFGFVFLQQQSAYVVGEPEDFNFVWEQTSISNYRWEQLDVQPNGSGGDLSIYQLKMNMTQDPNSTSQGTYPSSYALSEAINNLATLTVFENNTGTVLETGLTLGNSVLVFINGSLLEAGAEADYIINGNQIIFSIPLQSTDKVTVINGNLRAIDLSPYQLKLGATNVITTGEGNVVGSVTADSGTITVTKTTIEASKDYNELSNKPSINGITLSGNKTSNQLELQNMSIEVQNSGDTLPADTTGYNLGDKFLNKTNEKVYEVSNEYALNTDVINSADINFVTGVANGFEYNTQVTPVINKRINRKFTNLLWQGNKNYYVTFELNTLSIGGIISFDDSDITGNYWSRIGFYIKTDNKIYYTMHKGYQGTLQQDYGEKLVLDYVLQPNIKYKLNIFKQGTTLRVELNNANTNEILIINTLTTEDWYSNNSTEQFLAFGSFNSTGVGFTYVYYLTTGSIYLLESSGDFLVSSGNTAWDSGTALVNNTQYIDITNDILWLYNDNKLIQLNSLVATINFYESPSWQLDVTKTQLTVTGTLGNSVYVFKNGQLIQGGSGNDYTISGSVITFTTALEDTDKIAVINGNLTGIDLTPYLTASDLLPYQQKAQIIEDSSATPGGNDGLAIQANKVYKFTNANISQIKFASCEQSELITKIDFTTGATAPQFIDNSNIDWADGETPHFYSYQHYWIIISDKTGFVKEIY